MKVYIATTLTNKKKHNEVRDALKKIGVELTYDWTILGDVRHHGKEILRTVSIEELKGVIEADTVIVIMPGGRGTHVELGMALARRKPILLYLPSFSDLELLTVPEQTCAFYHHPLVITVHSVKDILVRIRAAKKHLDSQLEKEM